MFSKQKKLELTGRQFAFIVGTRALLATGVAMLAAGRIAPRIRRRVGSALVVIGVVSTIPALRALMRA